MQRLVDGVIQRLPTVPWPSWAVFSPAAGPPHAGGEQQRLSFETTQGVAPLQGRCSNGAPATRLTQGTGSPSLPPSANPENEGLAQGVAQATLPVAPHEDPGAVPELASTLAVHSPPSQLSRSPPPPPPLPREAHGVTAAHRGTIAQRPAGNRGGSVRDPEPLGLSRQAAEDATALECGQGEDGTKRRRHLSLHVSSAPLDGSRTAAWRSSPPHLPDEIWFIVFSYVSPDNLLSELAPLARVCRRWAQLIHHNPSMLRRLCFAGCAYRPDPRGADAILARCARSGNPEALFFRGVLACIGANQVRWWARGPSAQSMSLAPVSLGGRAADPAPVSWAWSP